jgi:hypothetical protein
MEHRPIFIGGLSFTGKTQLRMMLSAHPNILISRRTHLWDRFYNRYGNLDNSANLEQCLKAMLTFKPIRALHPNVELLSMEFSQGPRTYERLFALLHAQHARAEGKSRWGDQLGFIEQYADRIFAAYPSAKMIHMVRDPGARSGESRESSPRWFGRIGWETAWWLSSARLASRHQKLYPKQYLIVCYEQLFAFPERTMREVCDFLGETFYPQMLTHGEIESHSADRQHGLLKRDLHFIHSFAQEPMKYFGYGYDDLQLSRYERILYGLALPINLATLLAGTIGAGLGQREIIQTEMSL